MAKTAQQAVAKWSANATAAAFTAGVQGSQKPIVAAAVAQRQTAISNFGAALAPGGVWERHLTEVGDANIRQAAVNKASNFETGIQQNASKAEAAFGKIIAYENQNLPTIYAMPKGTRAASKARQNAWLDIMADGRGTLSAKG
jgi:hypothetical protein